MPNDHNQAPINPLPWIVWALALPMIAVEVVVQLGESGLAGGNRGLGWRSEAIQRFAYAPGFVREAWAQGMWIPPEPWRFISYNLVHPSFTSTLFALAILLALGKMVGEIFRWWAVAVVFLGASVLGALVYTVVPPGQEIALFGAYPGDYGLIGAFTFLLWVRLAGTGSNQYRAFTLIGVLMLAQLLFALVVGGNPWWVAELSGFAAGFLLSFLVSPGGWNRVVRRLRQR